ncbi:cellulose biosynthesis cyclic di-GMP-binding regulatory protein BcsB [Listeria valentina]|uniref:cellulose biosynthesis cyclic di-GMP-binding regulatory protein BcsB n=1 Tax=Listeria valentina TaxID=2705293 RepID=UPI001430E7EF|nr:cellulose biosynthesis cyclic di-GMP-binding regulatory protein BcsB [Listeria valentina]
MKKWLAGLFLIGIFLFAVRIEAEAAGNTYSFPFDSDREAQGKFTTTKESFTLEDYWQTNSVKLKLVYRVSPLLEQEVSSLTFRINGVFFHSFRPDGKTGGAKQLELEVPKEKLKKGENVLTIEGFVYSTRTDDRCTIDETPANWLHIDKATSIEVNYDEKPFSATIADFNKRFTGIDTISKKMSGVFTRAKSSNAEMTAGLRALASFSSRNNATDSSSIPFSTVSGGDKWDRSRYRLLLADYSHLQAKWKQQIPDDKHLKKEALMKLVQEGDKQVLIVTSKNKKALETAGRLLGNEELTNQLMVSEKWVGEDENVTTRKENLSKEVKLTESGDRVKGTGHVEQDYFVKLAPNQSITNGTKLDLHFRYAENLDFKHSLVTVLINGKPIASKKLSEKEANGDHFSVRVPKDLKVAGNFNLTVAFDFILEDNECGFTADSEIPWGFITSDTRLNLQTDEQEDLLFSHYPYPFIQDGEFDHTLIVLRDQLSEHEFGTLENLFHLLGSSVTGNGGALEVIRSKDFSVKDENKNLIVIGNKKQNQVMAKASSDLYFAYNKQGNYFVSNEKMKIDPSYGEKLGSVQLLPSIYNKKRAFLAVTGPTPEMTELGSNLLGSNEFLSKTYGDGVLIDQDENIHSYRFKKVAASGETSKIGDMLQVNRAVIPFGVVALLLLVLLVVATIFLVRKYRNK